MNSFEGNSGNKTGQGLMIFMAVFAVMILYVSVFKTMAYADAPGQEVAMGKEKTSALKAQSIDEMKIAAEVNGEPVTAQKLLKRYNEFLIISGYDEENRKRVTLDSYFYYYVTELLLLKEAGKMGISVSPDKVKEEKTEQLTKKGITEETLSKNLLKAGLTIEDADRYFEDYSIMKRLGEKKFGNLKISDEEALGFYSDNYKNFNHPDKIRVSHILICHKDSQGCRSDLTSQKARELAERIRKIATPENFSRLAKLYSSDSTGAKGGDLGELKKGVAVPSFEKAAFNLEKGEISDIVETSYGYHIIYVTDKQKARAVTFEEAKASIKRDLKEEHIVSELSRYSEQLLKEADIKKYAFEGGEGLKEPENKTKDTVESGKRISSNNKFPTFRDTGEDICTNDKGQPIVLFFGRDGCPHCKWVEDTFDDTVMEYVEMGLIEAHHYDTFTNDDLLTPNLETEIPMEYFKKIEEVGSVPYFNFGCRYDRVGTGYEATDDLFGEEIEMRKVLDDLLK
jgi:parvulin-like peptidyl-prolyl isomerase